MGLKLYLIFVTSWFLHLGTRVPALGAMRLDLILAGFLAYLALTNDGKEQSPRTDTDKWLRVLIAYAVLTIPFVYWPGSVIRHGIQEFIKAAVFYYFTIAFVRSEKDVRKFMVVFLACQLFRVLEPFYLHLTEDYWGSQASMADWEYLDRLSGAPSDTVNPNGLAFIVCTVIPFLWYLAPMSWKTWLASACLIPVCIYVLVLTGSRSGFLALMIIFIAILIKSKRRFLVAVVGVTVLVVGFPLMSPDMQDRYLSIVGKGEKNEGTAVGRSEGVKQDFEIALAGPVFGYGLGTSQEANVNFGAADQPAHNLYAETAEELGFGGMLILLLFIKSIFSGFAECKRAYQNRDPTDFLARLVDAMQVFLIMNVLFSFASYGLSSYEWYLLGGMSVALRRIVVKADRAIAVTPVMQG